MFGVNLLASGFGGDFDGHGERWGEGAAGDEPVRGEDDRAGRGELRCLWDAERGDRAGGGWRSGSARADRGGDVAGGGVISLQGRANRSDKTHESRFPSKGAKP